MKIFFDTEFTGFHKSTTLISIGLVSETGETFYCELDDYDKSQVDNWLRLNVIANLKHKRPNILMPTPLPEDKDISDYPNAEQYPFVRTNHFNNKKDKRNGFSIDMMGTKENLKIELSEWFSQFEQIEMWSDHLSYDWVLFNDIWGNALNLPTSIYYIPFDLCTLFKTKGIDPDVDREEFANMTEGIQKHNSLWDALVIQQCHKNLIDEKDDKPK